MRAFLLGHLGSRRILTVRHADVVRELHHRYLQNPEIKRPWRRGDVVRVSNGKTVLVTGTHPELTVCPYVFWTKLRYCFQEALTLVRGVFHPDDRPLQGYSSRLRTSGVSLFFEVPWPTTKFPPS